MPLRMFCLALAAVLSINAAILFLLSHSIRSVIVKTLAASLLAQVGYFASVLFLIWRSGRLGKAAKEKAKHSGRGQQRRRQWPTCPEDEE